MIMSSYTKEELAQVLRTAEILKQHHSSQKINVVQFCREAEISRKNAYKHKNNIEDRLTFLEQQIERLKQGNQELTEKLSHAEDRAHQADMYWECRNVLVALNADYKKNGPGQTPKRLKLIDSYNKLAVCLGFEPLSCWE